MLKYLYCKEVFEEVPNETTLGISLTGCKIKCDGCHSPELWKDTGKILNIDNFERILDVTEPFFPVSEKECKKIEKKEKARKKNFTEQLDNVADIEKENSDWYNFGLEQEEKSKKKSIFV